MKNHHAVVYLKNESEPLLKIVCVDPEHKAGTRDQDCPIQDFVADRGWSYFYMAGPKKEIFKFDFNFQSTYPDGEGGLFYSGEYEPIEGQVHPRGKPA